MNKIEAKKTVYKGIQFKSRLEARWAIFFDVMGIQYQYEPQHFSLDFGIKYTPDFILYNVHWRGNKMPIYAEVKGANSWKEISRDERVRIECFAKREPLIVLGNLPTQDEDPTSNWDQILGSFCFLDGDYYNGFFSNYFGEIWFAGQDHIQYFKASTEKALSIARQARFDQPTTEQASEISFTNPRLDW